jgi:hypothetical protein
MIYELRMSKNFFTKEEAAQYEAIGFKFQEQYYIHESNGVPSTSQLPFFEPKIEFNTLEELDAFLLKFGECVLFNYEENRCIEIYNDYREG